MGKSRQVPRWLGDACQGLAHWLSYQDVINRRPVGESAVVLALTTLISSHRESSITIDHEVSYEHLGRRKAGLARADLVVSVGDSAPLCVLEVVRVLSSYGPLRDELDRLSGLLDHRSGPIRAFVIATGQGCRPTKLVSLKGEALTVGRAPRAEFPVRRVLKSGASFTKFDRASYVCVVEADAGR